MNLKIKKLFVDLNYMNNEFNRKYNSLINTKLELKKYKTYTLIGIIIFPLIGVLIYYLMLNKQKEFNQEYKALKYYMKSKIYENGVEEYLKQIKKLLDIAKQ